jgi:hypothetical protein
MFITAFTRAAIRKKLLRNFSGKTTDETIWEDNIKVDHREKEFEVVDWNELAKESSMAGFFDHSIKP